MNMPPNYEDMEKAFVSFTQYTNTPEKKSTIWAYRGIRILFLLFAINWVVSVYSAELDNALFLPAVLGILMVSRYFSTVAIKSLYYSGFGVKLPEIPESLKGNTDVRRGRRYCASFRFKQIKGSFW